MAATQTAERFQVRQGQRGYVVVDTETKRRLFTHKEETIAAAMARSFARIIGDPAAEAWLAQN